LLWPTVPFSLVLFYSMKPQWSWLFGFWLAAGRSDDSVLIQLEVALRRAGEDELLDTSEGCDGRPGHCLGHHDGSVLIQRELVSQREIGEDVMEDAASLETIKLVESALKSFAKGFSTELRQFQVEQDRELNDVQLLQKYVSRLKTSFGRKGTLFSKMMGLAPAGPMDEIDSKMVADVLQLFRHKDFVHAVATGLDALAREAPALVWRTEHHIAELVRLGASSTDTEMSNLLADFFRKEQHILSGLLGAVDSVLSSALEAVPHKGSVTGIAKQLLARLLDEARARLHDTADEIVRTQGGTFCSEGNLDLYILDQVVPMINSTAAALPRLEAFAKEQVPDVAPQVSEASQWLHEISDALVGSLSRKAKGWFEKVCGFVGASSTEGKS